jgi:hypothetical protein
MANIPPSADDSIAATNDKQTPIPALLVKEQALPELDTSQNGSKPTEDTAGDSQGCEPEYVTGVKLVLVVASVALACFLMLVDTMVISTVGNEAFHFTSHRILQLTWNLVSVQAIPQITDQFHSLPDVGWYASAYQFGMYAARMAYAPYYSRNTSTYNGITALLHSQ